MAVLDIVEVIVVAGVVEKDTEACVAMVVVVLWSVFVYCS